MPGLSSFWSPRGTWRTNWDDACVKSAQSAHHPRVSACQRRSMPTAHPKQPADGPKCGAGVDISARRGSAAGWDSSIAQIAAEQHGLISLEQLRDLGMDRSTAQKRVDAGTLHRLHTGVYVVGYFRSTHRQQLMAAALACGPDAVVSHRSAAALWGLREDGRLSIDVTAPNRRGRVPKEIDAHRDGSLAPADRTVLHGIPCTAVPRTLLDFAAIAPIWELRKAISEAEVLRILNHDAVRQLIKRSRGRRGVARLRMVMDEIHPLTKRTRSNMELLFLRMCERAGLPQPEVNVMLYPGGRRTMPDFLWRDAGLIVEADSRRYHDTDSAFQGDREREQRLQLAGWRVSRCTWEQIEREPRRLAETIRGLLDQPRNAPMGRNVDSDSTFRPIGG
jgi:predicted transcriptional regulator of viral defense system